MQSHQSINLPNKLRVTKHFITESKRERELAVDERTKYSTRKIINRPMMKKKMSSFFQFFLLILLLLLGIITHNVHAIITKDEFLVTGLEEIEPAFSEFDGQMYAGLLSIDPEFTLEAHDDNTYVDNVGKLMFWLMESTNPISDDSLVIWFNGGPGCSSFHGGLFFEMGPVTTPLQPAGSFGQTNNEPYGYNKYAWSNATTIMYVEQPIGTGFSYGTNTPNNEEEVGRDFYYFLLHFNQLFPEHASKRLYLFGESYGGYYVSSFAYYIHQENKKHASSGADYINLQGIALGNGWAEVETQGPAVIDYAYWHGMIDSVTRDIFKQEFQHCLDRTGQEPEPFHPFTTPDECGMMEAVLAATGAGLLEGRSPETYDVTTWYVTCSNVILSCLKKKD